MGRRGGQCFSSNGEGFPRGVSLEFSMEGHLCSDIELKLNRRREGKGQKLWAHKSLGQQSSTVSGTAPGTRGRGAWQAAGCCGLKLEAGGQAEQLTQAGQCCGLCRWPLCPAVRQVCAVCGAWPAVPRSGHICCSWFLLSINVFCLQDRSEL